MAPILGYWNIRGLAQPIRLVLAYAGVEYTDKRYNLGPNLDRSEWTNEKFIQGLDFPNLPYYIDDGIKLTQSLAIIRHLANKHNLVGNTQEENNRISLVEQQIRDNHSAFVAICYDPDFEQLKVDFLNNLHNTLELLSRLIGDRKQFFAGERLTYVDFLAYEYLDQLITFSPQVVTQYNNLVQFLCRIESLPKIVEYLNSDKYTRWPLNNDMAQYGSRLQNIGQNIEQNSQQNIPKNIEQNAEKLDQIEGSDKELRNANNSSAMDTMTTDDKISNGHSGFVDISKAKNMYAYRPNYSIDIYSDKFRYIFIRSYIYYGLYFLCLCLINK